MLKLSSLRTRFILAYVGLIIIGFGALAAIAGKQLSDAARENYERQTISEIELAARGIERAIMDFYREDISQEDLESIIEEYEAQIDAELTLFLVEPPERNAPPDTEHNDHAPDRFDLIDQIPELNDYPELMAAAQGPAILVQRENENGQDTIYTATIISRNQIGIIQSSEPATNLYFQIYERWSLLGLGVGIVALLSLIASVYLARSLIRPLRTLQNAALELSEGNLGYRAPNIGTDELNTVVTAFNTMADQLEEMIEEQRAFASNASHELRTPITAIRIRTETLRYDTNIDTQTREQYIQEIDDEVLRMSGLMDDLVLLSRLDAGRTQKGSDAIDFLRFAESLQRSYSRQATEKKILLDVVPPANHTDLVSICASLNHVTIFFRNILENALKYTPEGGKITWHIDLEGDEIISRIEDNGQGIEPSALPHIFDRFFRGDRSHNRDIPGTGLGLALVKSIADVYDTKLTIHSAGKDQGTTVSVHWQQHIFTD